MNNLDILAWLDEHVQRDANLCMDSRQIEAGDVFFACPGLTSDGRDFIAAAIAAGAAAIVCQADTDGQAKEFGQQYDVPFMRVSQLTDMLGAIAHIWYGRPSDALTVIAVTGTNGKTSTSQWIAAALNSENMPCGTIGTLGVTLADGTNLGGVLTTPDVLTMHRSLAAIAKSGGVAAAIEASSIGIVQGRLDGVSIQVAGFTNLTHDHLDYHGDLQSYKSAKLKLFERPGLSGAIINQDDPLGVQLLAGKCLSSHKFGYSIKADVQADFKAEDIQHGVDGLVFNLITPSGQAQIVTHLLGEYNVANVLLVAGVLRELGWGLSRTARALAKLQPVAGRLQVVNSPVLGGSTAQLPLVVVDYAHTPDALERVLGALQPMCAQRGGRLWCVFGCGGDRDAFKRPLMGAVAERMADKLVITSDNPRSEDPAAIIAAIASGIKGPAIQQVERERAILQTVWSANAGDVILLAGKGHEIWQEAKGQRRAFDDRDWASVALLWRSGASLSSDTRSLVPGQVFVALKGPNFDGHNYLATAAQAGAKVALVAHKTGDSGLLQLVLGDTLQALQVMASEWRRQFQIPVVAVTGSNGKTTTKEMLGSILRAWLGADASLATPGNLNNAIGVPLSVLRLRPVHKAAVFELGMNHPGEIAQLAQIAQPTVALVNNAQREHQEFMCSVDAVAAENGSVLSHLPEDGVAVFPLDENYASLWAELAGTRQVRRFGFNAQADVYAANIKAAPEYTEFILYIGKESVQIKLQAPGRHNLHNALAAATCAWAAGAELQAIAAGLHAFVPVGGRMQPWRMADGFQLIDDTYNANPDSVRAAIDVLVALEGKRVLVLGDMGEVGAQGPAMHAEIGAYAKQSGVDVVFGLGPASKFAVQAFGAGAQAYDEFDALLAAVLAARPGHILVKGSRSMRMERVVQALLADSAIQGDSHAT